MTTVHAIKVKPACRVSQVPAARAGSATAPDNASYSHTGSEGVSIITVTNRPAFIAKVYENFLRQTYSPKELVIILNNNEMDLNTWKQQAPASESIKVFQLDETISLGECYNFAVGQSRFPYLAKFDDDDYYGAGFIHSGIATLTSVNAHVIGKSCRYIYFESSSTLALHEPYPEYSYVEYVPGATMIIKREVFDQVKFPDLNEGEDSIFQEECIRRGFLIYAGDRFNYVTIRRRDIHTHTFKLDDQTYMDYCKESITVKDFRPLINKFGKCRIDLR